MGVINHYYGFSFALSDLPSTKETEIHTLFRQYRIDRVTLRFVPTCGVNTAGDWMGPSAYNPITFNSLTSIAICYDDDAAPASEADVLRYENVQLHPTMGQPWQISLVPRVKLDGNTINAYPMMGGQWVDTAMWSAKHYGVKICVPSIGGAADNELGFHLYVKYDYSLRTFM